MTTAALSTLLPEVCPGFDTDYASRQRRRRSLLGLASHTRLAHSLTEATSHHRFEVEQFIQRCFAATYSAHVTHFMPQLFSLRSKQSELLGALGVRPASQKLFLECYLDDPVEVLISRKLGRPVERQRIIEVGQFAGDGAGAARAMIVQLTEYLYRQGYHWVVFTGTSSLRNAFSRLGLRPVDVAEADPARLAHDEQAMWGSYYQHRPRVLFGDIAEGFATIGRMAASPYPMQEV
ncbi:thermostable hemolysin [Uliginosibacterium gangwonense]|uniref:thermostable hemolysin n=1 Tax=Uliginosibacterium gangwonense TaxID=392736 RepID=UPI000A016999|nr:thermostable hemolysin [Uliginosibacterium gangwonense]